MRGGLDVRAALLGLRGELDAGVYGGKPQRHRVHGGRTDGEDYLIRRKILFSFQVLAIRKIARLCELCGSVVGNRSLYDLPDSHA
jgi:hypothetical protein